ncbi:MAG: hypothetical protein GY801_51840 [bacterium]|nr:hypothetical protein [bacterium]
MLVPNALRGNPARTLCVPSDVTQSVEWGVPTQSVERDPGQERQEKERFLALLRKEGIDPEAVEPI